MISVVRLICISDNSEFRELDIASPDPIAAYCSIIGEDNISNWV